MPSICDPIIEPACAAAGRIAKGIASSAGGDLLSGLAQAISDGVRWIVVNTATWWINISSPGLAGEPAVTRLQQWLLPVTAAVAIAGVIAAGARMALTRKASPLLDVTGGLISVAAASTVGVTAAALLLKADDAWAGWVLHASTGGHFTQRLADALDFGGTAAPAVVIVFGLVAIVLSLVQAALMLFRQAALVILAGALPLAAAGAIAPMTRTWVRKVTAWMLALICYKPAAAAVYAAAFTMIGNGGSTQTALMGFVMLWLAVLTLPALMRFFTWTTGAVGGSAGGAQLLGTAAAGAIAIGALRGSSSGGSSATGQATYLDSRLGPGPAGGSPGGPNASPSGPNASPSGPAPYGPAGSPRYGTPPGNPPAAGGGPAAPPASRFPGAAGAAAGGAAPTGATGAAAGPVATTASGPVGTTAAGLGATAPTATGSLATGATEAEEQR